MATEDKSHVDADAEVTADISLELSYTDADGNTQSAEYTIQSLDVSKEVELAEIRGNNVKLESTATTTIDYSGSLTFHGDKKSYFDDKLFKDDDTPRECEITITHGDGSPSGYTGVKMTSQGYTADEGDGTETSYDFLAMDET